MRRSDLSKVSNEARDHYKAQSLLARINRRLDFYSRRMQHRLKLSHVIRASHASSELRALINGNPNGEIKSSLSSRTMIKKPTAETLEYIFEGLPKPTQRQYTAFEHELIQQMNEAGETQRATTAKTLLLYEIAWAAKENYYMLFNTLTVTNGTIKETFAKGSTKFKEYIRKFTRQLPGDIRDEKDHKYFAVVEEGGKTGRLHIHVLHIFKELPKGIRDPNYGRDVPNYWEISRFKNLWDKGWSVPKIVRYSPQDAWGKKGFRWPIDRETQLPYEVGSPLRLATYMSKYIMKSFKSKKRERYQWRIRKTQNLGQAIMMELMSTFTLQDLLNVATNDSLTANLNNSRIPSQLLRLAALRLYNQKNQNYRSTEQHKPSLGEMGKYITTRPSPLQHSNDSIQNSLSSNQQNIGITQITPINVTDTYDNTIQLLEAGAKRINARYFARPTGNYGTADTTDQFG